MTTPVRIVDDPSAYGSKGQSWDPTFVAYMVEMVTHPVYDGMPDAVKDDGKIQWEAPSNRSGGQHQDTHHRRRDWWRAKARSIGVEPTTDQWISTVAKRIHPTGSKPCKRCGRMMRIAYAYPNGHLKRRLERAFGPGFEFDRLESVTDLVRRVADQYGPGSLPKFEELLRTRDIIPPSGLTDIDAWDSWLENEYILREPSLLSPGAMSNPPDRFDGFHSFNLCCRGEADTGRHDPNMRSYTTDRRVFEYWSDGDWIAADRMMGLISATMRAEECANGGNGPPTADHIGPLSLGFSHRPHFRLLSRSANSAKNNRMTPEDVLDLIAAEARGEPVASWYADPLWQLRKAEATTDELALRLSKVLRDNQRAAMQMLVLVYHAGHFTFLASLLGLQHADYRVEFEHLRVERHVPIFYSVKHTSRVTKYAAEQKARRLRIGFAALRAYGQKANRHASIIPTLFNSAAKRHLAEGLETLERGRGSLGELDSAIASALNQSDALAGELTLRQLAKDFPELREIPHFGKAREHLAQAMSEVGAVLSRTWNSDRYVRGTPEELEDE